MDETRLRQLVDELAAEIECNSQEPIGIRGEGMQTQRRGPRQARDEARTLDDASRGGGVPSFRDGVGPRSADHRAHRPHHNSVTGDLVTDILLFGVVAVAVARILIGF